MKTTVLLTIRDLLLLVNKLRMRSTTITRKSTLEERRGMRLLSIAEHKRACTER